MLYDNTVVDPELTDDIMSTIIDEYHSEIHMLGNAVSAAMRHEKQTLEQFVRRFLTGRVKWWDIPKIGAVTNFGTIISLVLYRKGQFQVELFISGRNNGEFPVHRHPDVDTYEFPLSGDNILYMNGRPIYTPEQTAQWLTGNLYATAVHISPNDWHAGIGNTPYAFLSMQHWLNNVQPTSVGLNWIGDPSSVEQQEMWLATSEQQMLA